MKKKSFFGVFFVCFTFGMFVSVVLDSGERLYEKIQTAAEGNERWNALQEYPFSNKEEAGVAGSSSYYKKIYNRITSVENQIQRRLSSNFSYRIPFVLIKKRMDRMMGFDMTTSLTAGKNDLNSSDDIVVRCSEDYLGFVADKMDVSGKVDEIANFGTKMMKEGRNFLFMMVPGKYKGNIAYPDYSSENEEYVKDELELGGIDILSLPNIVKEEGIGLSTLFFKTDHHWLPSAGIWADKLLCETLNKRYGYQLDASFFDPDQYETTILEEKWLGSQGRKVTEVYCQKEDFPVVLPKYETDLQVFISGKNEAKSGTIKDTLLDYSVFNETSVYKHSDYNFYGYGNQPLIRIHNNKIYDGSHILILKSSFADCMYPYLASVVEDLDVIDLRLFNGSLQTYIKRTDPDTVVIVYGISSFSGAQESGDPFDFR